MGREIEAEGKICTKVLRQERDGVLTQLKIDCGLANDVGL
jgi:hypothetical protein